MRLGGFEPPTGGLEGRCSSTELQARAEKRSAVLEEGLAERCSSPGCDGRSLARTQGGSIAEAIGETEDTASGRPARPGDTATFSPNPPTSGGDRNLR